MIEAWMETIGVVGLAGLSAMGGWGCSKRRGLGWLVGYGVALSLVIVISLPRWFPSLELVPPFVWAMTDRREFALLAVAVPLLFSTLLPRLPSRTLRISILALASLVTVYFCVSPFLAPALNYRRLSELETMLDSNGVCLQSNGYTCGPAAAVTALHHIGIKAEEGELAVLAHTTRLAGTPTDSLCHAITRRYGVDCRQVYFQAVKDLRGREPVIVVVKYGFLIDHFITVLQVTDSHVIVGDPLEGRIELSHDDFARKWRRLGIVLSESGYP